MVSSRKLIVVIFLLILGLAFAQAQKITTPVRFILPTTLSFTLAIPGTNATAFASTIAGATATTIIYNTTNATESGINATAAGGATQGPAIPIFNLTNTGNVNINITINFSTALPSGVAVKASWGTNGYQTGANACTASAAGPPTTTTCSNVTATNVLTTIANMSTSGGAKYREVWLWADYSSVTVSTDVTVNLVFTSLNTTG